MQGDSSHQRSSLTGFRTVSLLTLASRILGFARDSAMAAVFGLGEILDAFTLAFRIPNLARSLFGEGALSTAFLPAYVAKREQQGEQAAQRLAMAVARNLAVILFVVIGTAELILGGLLILGGPSPYQQRLYELLILMTPYLFLICLTALAGAILQAERRFAWPAVAPVLLNTWWLIATGLISLMTHDQELRIRGIAFSLLIGGTLQLMLPVLVLKQSGWRWMSPDAHANHSAKLVFKAMIPTVLAASISQSGTILDSLLAWVLASPDLADWYGGKTLVEPGAAAALYLAQRLYQFPMGLIGVGVGTVLFPILASHAAKKDFGSLRKDLTHALCAALSVALPASGGLVVLSVPVTAVLFQHGQFSASDTILTSRIMAIYSCVSWAAIALLLLQRGMFSIGDRITPMKTGLMAVAFNIILIPFLVSRFGGTGLAMATAMSTLLNLTASFWMLRRHSVQIDWAYFANRVSRSLLSTAVMMLACWGVLQIPALSNRSLLQLVAAMATGMLTYLVVGTILGVDEPLELIHNRKSRRNQSAVSNESESV